MTEIFRAGILAVGRGQVEAGQGPRADRLSDQSLSGAAPGVSGGAASLGNQFISLIKDSSLAVAISVRELTYAAVRNQRHLVAHRRSLFCDRRHVPGRHVRRSCRAAWVGKPRSASEADETSPDGYSRSLSTVGGSWVRGLAMTLNGLGFGHGDGAGCWPVGRPGVALWPAAMRLLVRGYVDFVRGTPLLVLIF